MAAPLNTAVLPDRLATQLASCSDEALITILNRFRSTPMPSPPHITIPRPRTDDEAFDHRTLLNLPQSVFELVFPRYNAVAPLVIRGNTGCHHVTKILKANPAFAKLVTHIEFVDYHSSDGGDQPKVEVLQLCKNLDTVTVDIHIDDVVKRGLYAESNGSPRSGLHSLHIDDIKAKYKFNAIVFDKDTKHKKRINHLKIRFVGEGVWWSNRHLKRESLKNPGKDIVYEGHGAKVEMAKDKMIAELTERMNKKAVKVKLLESTGVADRYEVRMLDRLDRPCTDIPMPQ